MSQLTNEPFGASEADELCARTDLELCRCRSALARVRRLYTEVWEEKETFKKLYETLITYIAEQQK